MLSVQDYNKLVAPCSVALVGVTSRTGRGSNNPLEILIETGYRGTIYPCNRRGEDILGITTYQSVLELPEVPDLAIICAPRNAVPELFAQCAEKGINLVIIVAQGFSDGDEEGKQMQRKLFSLAKSRGIRIIGPNTLGVINNFDRFCTSFMRFINRPAPVGILCQSGIFVVAAAEVYTGAGICIDTGNTTDVDFGDLIGHLAADSRLKVINLHLEGVKEGGKLMLEARKAATQKPMLVLKTGRSKAGARVAGSHTGSMAGEDRVADAAFRQCGLIRADNVEELNDFNKTFLTFDDIGGRRIAVMSISGGAGIISADACAAYGMELATLSDRSVATLQSMNPSWLKPANPVDIWPAAMLAGYHQVCREILRVLLEDPNVDAVICITASFLEEQEDFLDISGLVREEARAGSGKPVVAWTYGARSRDYIKKFEQEGNVVAYPTLERAVKSLSVLYRYHHTIRKKVGQRENDMSVHPATDTADARQILSVATGEILMPDALKLLEAYGIPTAPWRYFQSAEEALLAAGKVGYPLVLKGVGLCLSHKTEAGVVKLGISDPGELAAACLEMETSISGLNGFVVQKEMAGGTEVLVGFKRDPQFGPVLAFGSGGVFTEVLDDVSLRVAPLDREDACEMIRETKVYRILSGYRGKPRADEDALAGCILRLAKLAMDFPALTGFDINPLMAGPDGVVALDARAASR